MTTLVVGTGASTLTISSEAATLSVTSPATTLNITPSVATGTRPSPASLLIDGDSYLAGTGLTDPKQWIVTRVVEALGLGSGHYENLSVSGSPCRTTYYRVWQLLDTRRTADPYVPDVAAFLYKASTNDAIRGTTAAQEYGYKGALRSILAHCQAGSVYPHNDATVAVDASWTQLLWADLAAVAYDVDEHSSAEPWGGDTGCYYTATDAAVITITVPDDHTGAVDLFFIGSLYGGTATIAVDGVADGTLVTGGCGIPSYGTSRADERNGLVYRVDGLTAGVSHSITITASDFDAGTANNPGQVRFDHWTMKAVSDPFMMVCDCPQIPDTADWEAGLWQDVTAAVCTEYTTWINEVADEINGASGLTAPVKVVAVQTLNTEATAGNAAGHPNAQGAVDWAAAIVDAYRSSDWDTPDPIWNASWTTDDAAGERGSTVFTGSGPPAGTTLDFEGGDSLTSLGTGWTNVIGVAGITGGDAYLVSSGANPFVTQKAYYETLMPNGIVTATISAAMPVQNNTGLLMRYIDSSNWASLNASASYPGLWVFHHVVDGTDTQQSVVGTSALGTVVRAEFNGDQWTFSFNGTASVTGAITATGLETGTKHGLVWSHSGATRWSTFGYGAVDDVVENDVWIDCNSQSIYRYSTEWSPAISFAATAASTLTRLLTVDGSGSGLDADKLDGVEGSGYVPKSLVTTAGDLIYATANATTARLGIGTGLQILRTNSGATAPEWATGGLHLLDEETITSATTPVTLTIPSGYRALRIYVKGRTTRAATSESVIIDFNGDTTSANYDRNYVSATDTTLAADGAAGSEGTTARLIGSLAGSTAPASHPGSIIIDVFDYADTTYYKFAHATSTMWTARGATGLTVWHNRIGWANTAAITSVGFRNLNGNNYDVDTHFAAYGIG